MQGFGSELFSQLLELFDFVTDNPGLIFLVLGPTSLLTINLLSSGGGGRWGGPGKSNRPGGLDLH